MYFNDLLAPDADYERYRKVLQQLAQFVLDCVKFPVKAHDVAMHASYGDGRLYHGTVLMLTRLFCEQMDGMAVLTAEGCAEPSKPLIRSAFEASLGIQYILAKDSERRGLAYQLAHAHRKIKLYRKLDPNDPVGKELRNSVKGDILGVDVLASLPPMNFPAFIKNLTGMLARPPFLAIEQEWIRTKKVGNGDPAWFVLFGGPRTIRALASQLGKAAWYEFLYSEWSDTVHAGSGMSHVAKNTSAEGGPVVIRPLRHPEGLQALARLAAGMCLELTRLLLAKYGTEKQRQEMKNEYVTHVQQRFREVMTQELIKAPWR